LKWEIGFSRKAEKFLKREKIRIVKAENRTVRFSIYVNLSPSLYILKREVNLWKYSRAGKNYRVEKAVTS